LKEFWRGLIDCGNKSVGTQAKLKAEQYIFRRTKEISADAHLMEFYFEGWEVCGNGTLLLTSPIDKELNGWLFLGSGGGKFEGSVRRMGYNYVWNMYGWDRYAILDGRKITAYISGRQEGDALSQTLIEGNCPLPHFIIGAEDNKLLKMLLYGGAEVRVGGEANCRSVHGMRGANVVLPLPAESKKRKKVILTAHYDTMYNTPGAYDNAAGCAVLMSLARELSSVQLDRDIDIVFTDAEECRLEGSKHYASRLNPDEIDYVLNIDGVGRGEELEIWCGNEAFERKIAEALLDYTPIPCQTYKNPPPPGSDHAPFYEKGIKCCMLTFNDQGILHTPEDVYEEKKLFNMRRMFDLAIKIILQF